MPGTASVMVSFFGKPMPSAAADAAALAEEAELELELELRAMTAALVDTQRVSFIRGWDARGMASQLHSFAEQDQHMRELLDAHYPRAAINDKERT